MISQASEPLLELRDVRKHYKLSRGGLAGRRTNHLKAVDGLSLRIPAGATYSLVGETGAGKSTVAKLVLRIERCDAGEILFGGLKVFAGDERTLNYYRSSISAVYQDPWSSLNPRMKVQDIVAEPLVTHGGLRKTALKARIDELLTLVGLSGSDADHYPHQFSGGQRQRIAIARALSTSPKLIVLDEPVSSLDVSIRAQILNLLKRLQKQFEISYLLIAHDLAAVRFLSHRVGVMYLGKIVEEAEARDLFASPLHPYTRALLAASVAARPGIPLDERGVPVSGEMPSPLNPPPGCTFHPRCPYRFEPCPSVIPELQQAAPDHWVSCHLYGLEGYPLRAAPSAMPKS
jgi:oligopeptide transport system ATP-binding protein